MFRLLPLPLIAAVMTAAAAAFATFCPLPALADGERAGDKYSLNQTISYIYDKLAKSAVHADGPKGWWKASYEKGWFLFENDYPVDYSEDTRIYHYGYLAFILSEVREVSTYDNGFGSIGIWVKCFHQCGRTHKNIRRQNQQYDKNNTYEHERTSSFSLPIAFKAQRDANEFARALKHLVLLHPRNIDPFE